jgi:urease accessory protein
MPSGKNNSTSNNNYSNLLTDIEDLGMLQLSDSFFPSGMYTTSNGLEALFYDGRKKMTPIELFDLIKIYLEYQIGPADCTALGNAYECAIRSDLTGLIKIDEILFSMKLIQEIRSASVRSGTQLLRCIHSFMTTNKILSDYAAAIRDGLATGLYPVALAAAASAFSIPKRKVGIMMLYSFSVSIVGAALRLGMLQHFDGQRVINELKPVISTTVSFYIDRPIDGIWQFAPQIDIIQIMHETMSSKMFIT